MASAGDPRLSSADVRSGARIGDAPELQVVFVCTANRARSPFAAALMRRQLAAFSADVESFGTMEAAAGAPALAGAVRAANEFGIDLSGHRARPLPPAGLDGRALVIGFELFHVAAAVVVGGAERSRTFLLTELATTLEDSIHAAPVAHPSRDALLALADGQRRARGGLPTPIADPVGASERRFHDIFHEIDRLVTVVATSLVSASIERPD